jgi:hypothetical protein
MALFKNIAEIQEYLPVTLTFKFPEILPFITQVERDYLIPILSKAQYDVLSAAYNVETPTLSAKQTQLLTECRMVIAPLAYCLWIPFGQVRINTGGIHIVVSETHKTAFQWQVDKLESSALNSGLSAIENLITFLEENVGDFPEWKASESYTISRMFFVSSAKKFNEYYPINQKRYLFLQIKPFLPKIERESVQPILGRVLFNKVKDSLLAEATTNTEPTIEEVQHENELVLTVESESLDSILFSVANTPLKIAPVTISFVPDESGNNEYEYGSSHVQSIDYESGQILLSGFDPTVVSGSFYVSYTQLVEIPAEPTQPTLYPELLEYIRPVVVYGALLKAAVRLSLIIDERGVSVFNNNNSATSNVVQGVREERMIQWKKELEEEYNSAQQELVKFLDENHEDYPDYPYSANSNTRFDNNSSNNFFYAGQ